MSGPNSRAGTRAQKQWIVSPVCECSRGIMRGETSRGCTSARLGSRLVWHLSLGAPLPCSSARKMPHAQDRAPPVNGDTLDTPCALSGRQGPDQTREERSKFGLRPTRCTPLRQRKLVDALRTFGSFSHNHANI